MVILALLSIVVQLKAGDYGVGIMNIRKPRADSIHYTGLVYSNRSELNADLLHNTSVLRNMKYVNIYIFNYSVIYLYRFRGVKCVFYMQINNN